VLVQGNPEAKRLGSRDWARKSCQIPARCCAKTGCLCLRWSCWSRCWCRVARRLWRRSGWSAPDGLDGDRGGHSGPV